MSQNSHAQGRCMLMMDKKQDDQVPEVMALSVFGWLSQWQPRTWKSARQSAIITAPKDGALLNVDHHF